VGYSGEKRGLGGCPRIEAVARGSGFETIFSIIKRRILGIFNDKSVGNGFGPHQRPRRGEIQEVFHQFNRGNGPKSAFPQ